MCKVVCAFNSDHSRPHRASRGRLLLLLLPAKTLGRENLLQHFHHTSHALCWFHKVGPHSRGKQLPVPLFALRNAAMPKREMKLVHVCAGCKNSHPWVHSTGFSWVEKTAGSSRKKLI